MSQALFERWINGDESAFEALYDGYYVRIRNFATALIGNPTEGEDLAQETFMRLHRHRAQLQQTGVENGRALIYTIARRLAYQYTAYRRRWENLIDMQPLRVIERETPEDLLTAAEIGAHIQQAIDSLPEPQREVILLRHREMLTYDEIAHILNCPVSRLKARLHYARKQLRAHLMRLGVVP